MEIKDNPQCNVSRSSDHSSGFIKHKLVVFTDARISGSSMLSLNRQHQVGLTLAFEIIVNYNKE